MAVDECEEQVLRDRSQRLREIDTPTLRRLLQSHVVMECGEPTCLSCTLAKEAKRVLAILVR